MIAVIAIALSFATLLSLFLKFFTLFNFVFIIPKERLVPFFLSNDITLKAVVLVMVIIMLAMIGKM